MIKNSEITRVQLCLPFFLKTKYILLLLGKFKESRDGKNIKTNAFYNFQEITYIFFKLCNGVNVCLSTFENKKKIPLFC